MEETNDGGSIVPKGRLDGSNGSTIFSPYSSKGIFQKVTRFRNLTKTCTVCLKHLIDLFIFSSVKFMYSSSRVGSYKT